MSTKTPPIVANAYAVVPEEEKDFSPASIASVELDKPASRSARPEYEHIPETQGLSWEDDFFDDDDDIIAVFDFDYDSMESYYSKIGWGCLAGTCLFPNMFTLAMLGMVPCYLDKNISWKVRAQHVAVTRDGIRFVHDKRPTCWGMSCTDAGKRSKTIPFDKITDCDVAEPAGNTCLWIPNTLYSVAIDTASSEKRNAEICLTGLKNPHEFKKLVLAMKRAFPTPSVATLPSVLEMTGRGQARSDNNESVAELLREIRDELRQHNEVIKTLGKTDVAAPLSQPSIADLGKPEK